GHSSPFTSAFITCAPGTSSCPWYGRAAPVPGSEEPRDTHFLLLSASFCHALWQPCRHARSSRAFARGLPTSRRRPLLSERGFFAVRVLVVEDDPLLRSSIEDALSDAGHVAASATDGARALDALERSEVLPEVIVLDLMMPNMSGELFR